MKTAILTILVVTSSFVACLAEETLTNRTTARLTSNATAITNAESLFKAITGGSAEVRKKAEEDLYLTYQRMAGPGATNEQAKALVHSLGEFRNKVRSGDTTEAQFNLYSETVETLILDLTDGRKVPQDTYDTFLIKFAIQQVAGDSVYFNRMQWTAHKKQLENHQKWNQHKIVPEAAAIKSNSP